MNTVLPDSHGYPLNPSLYPGLQRNYRKGFYNSNPAKENKDHCQRHEEMMSQVTYSFLYLFVCLWDVT